MAATIQYPTINYRQRHTRLIDSSDDYGQLKSTRNKVNDPRWKSKSDNAEVRRKSQSTINEESRHSTKGIDNQRSTRIGKVRLSQIDLLTYCRQPQYRQSRWPTVSNDNRQSTTIGNQKLYTIRCDTRCYFNVRSKANISQLNLRHGTDN